MTERSRKEFEEWADFGWWNIERNSKGEYRDRNVRAMWEAWKFSR